MPLLELPIITAASSVLTFLVSLWIAFSVHRHQHDPEDVPLRTRLRHPNTPCDEIGRTSDPDQRDKGA